MTGLPFDADTFYRLRDSRTDLCGVDPRYTRVRCWLSVGPEVLTTHSGQVMVLSAGILLARWCRDVHIHLHCDAPILVRSGNSATTFTDLLLHHMMAADPFGKFAWSASSPACADVRLHVGERCAESGIPTTVLSCCGWLASIGRPGFIGFPFVEAQNTRNTIGAMFAAGFGVAQAFFDAVGQDSPFGTGTLFDAFALKRITSGLIPAHPFPNNRDIGRVLSIGAGSVASAAVYCMIHAGITATTHFVDRDIVKFENISRGPTFDVAKIGQQKSCALAASCEGSGIVGTCSEEWWDEFIEVDDALAGFDLWLPLANERGVRLAIAQSAPPLLIHASTTRNVGASFGRHIPGRDDCLAERFAGAEVAPQFRCSTAAIKVTPEKQIDAALPFLSFVAGALIVADLLRLKLDGYPQVSNYALIDLGGDSFAPQVLPRRAAAGCWCSQMAGVTRVMRGGSRYHALIA